MSDPDFDALTAVNDELRRQIDADEVTQESFDKLLEQAKEAVGENEEFLEGFLMRGFELGFVK